MLLRQVDAGLHCSGSAAGTNFSPAVPYLTVGVHSAPKEPQGSKGQSPAPPSHCSLQSSSSSSFFIPAARPALLRCPSPSPPSLPVQLCCCSALHRAAASILARPGAGAVPQPPPPLTLLLPAPSQRLTLHFARSLPAGTEADELNPAPITCSLSSKACLLPLLQHGALCGSRRGEERAGERAGAGSLGEHAGRLGRVSTGAYGSWEHSTGCTANSVPPLQTPT